MSSWHGDGHYSERNNWLRAVVLGANDGLISVGSLLMGMIVTQPSISTLTLAGISALVAGAVSMAAGEYVSVSSQSDTELADMEKEAAHLANYPDKELIELTSIYEKRGLSHQLAHEVAIALTEHDALATHMRDEIGISEIISTNALQAAFASAISFSLGAIIPLIAALVATQEYKIFYVLIATLSALIILGCISAKLGGAKMFPAVRRIFVLGLLALFTSGLVGYIIDFLI